MHKLLPYIFIFILTGACTNSETKSEHQSAAATVSDTTLVDFWNGNRSEVRQDYERQVLEAVLTATEPDFGPWELKENLDEYPGAEEGTVFSEKGHHLFVTIAGNRNFREDERIVINEPLTKNLLGYRVPIIREEDSEKFNAISNPGDIQQLDHGIPATWSDAVIFRHNGYSVVEEGTFDDIFERLASGLFDYSAYGANEVLGVFENRASKQEGLTIDDRVILYYPFPLVFYINPGMPELAERVEQGLKSMIEAGTLDAIFDEYYSNITEELNLDQRVLFILENPLIPEEFSDLKPDLEIL